MLDMDWRNRLGISKMSPVKSDVRIIQICMRICPKLEYVQFGNARFIEFRSILLTEVQTLNTRSLKKSRRKTVEALCDLIEELEKQRGRDLNEKQTDAMIRLIDGLVSSIKSKRSHFEEKRSGDDFVLHARTMRAHMRAWAVHFKHSHGNALMNQVKSKCANQRISG
jgi:hypothetical protein